MIRLRIATGADQHLLLLLRIRETVVRQCLGRRPAERVAIAKIGALLHKQDTASGLGQCMTEGRTTCTGAYDQHIRAVSFG